MRFFLANHVQILSWKPLFKHRSDKKLSSAQIKDTTSLSPPVPSNCSTANPLRFVSIGQSIDSHPLYGVSDGTSYIEIQTVDQSNYCCSHYFYPCHGVQGTSGETYTDRGVFDKTSPSEVAKFYPVQFVFTFKVEKSWVSCFTAQGGGLTNTVNYTRQLLPSQKVFVWRFIKYTNRRELVLSIWSYMKYMEVIIVFLMNLPCLNKATTTTTTTTVRKTDD